jgi:hypothetical protein
MSKSNIRTTSFVAHHVSRQFSAQIGCMLSVNALGANHVSGLYLEQTVSRSNIFNFRVMYVHHIQDSEAAFREQINVFHRLARKVFRVFILHR